jgi:acyl-coenzyme A thioesterase PaaI-like protein
VIRAGRSIIFAEAEARTEDGEIVAQSTGVFKPARG